MSHLLNLVLLLIFGGLAYAAGYRDGAFLLDLWRQLLKDSMEMNRDYARQLAALLDKEDKNV